MENLEPSTPPGPVANYDVSKPSESCVPADQEGSALLRRLREHERNVLSKGGSLPAHPLAPGLLSLALMAKDMGLPAQALGCLRTSSASHAAIAAMAAAYPILVRDLGDHGLPSLDEAFETIAAHRATSLGRGGEGGLIPAGKAALANFRLALNFARKAGFGGQPVDVAIDSALALLRADPEIPGGRKHRAELGKALALIPALFEQDNLPPDLGPAIRQAAANAGLPLRQLAALIKVNYQTLMSWVSGQAMPNPHARIDIEAMEVALNCPGALTRRMHDRRCLSSFTPQARFPERLRGPAHKVLRARIVNRLRPEDLRLDDAALHPIIEAIETGFAGEMSAFEKARIGLAQRPYALSALPPLARAEFDLMVKVQTVPFSTPLLPTTKAWSPGSERKYDAKFRGFLGALAMPPEEGGLGLPVAALSLALLGIPSLAIWFVRFLLARKESVGLVRAVSSMNIEFIKMARRLLQPERGFLRQQPSLAAKLFPIEGLLSAEAIDAYRADWDGACAAAYARLTTDWKSQASNVKEQVDKHHRIAPILRARNPLAAFHLWNEVMVGELRALADGEAYWRALRNAVVIGIETQCALRAETAALLDRDHLVIRPSSIRIVAPRQLYKNRDSSVFKAGNTWINYEFELQDEHGLFELIRLYVGQGRARLLDGVGARTEALFVNRSRRPSSDPKDELGRFTAESFSDLIRTLSERHLAENARLGTGIVGVKAFGAHLIRDILATGVLKATGNEAFAAAAIHDTIDVVKAYYAYWPLAERMAAAQAASRAARGQAWSD